MCAECGRLFSINDTIKIRRCPRLRELQTGIRPENARGGAAEFCGSATATEEQILAREYRIDIGSAVNRGWATFTNNAGVTIAMLLLAGLACLVFFAVCMVVSMVIPAAANVLSVFFTVPLLAGLLWFSLRLVRGQAAEFSDGFAGFRTH